MPSCLEGLGSRPGKSNSSSIRDSTVTFAARAYSKSTGRGGSFLVDNELRDTTGLAAIKFARTLAHRESLPIILFSIEDCEQEAGEVDAIEFLRKPHDLFLLIDIARRLISAGGKKP